MSTQASGRSPFAYVMSSCSNGQLVSLGYDATKERACLGSVIHDEGIALLLVYAVQTNNDDHKRSDI